MSVFSFKKPSVDLRHFRVFAFCHRAYSKTRNPRKIFISTFFEELRVFIWFWALFRYFVHSGHNSQFVTDSYQWASAWKWLLKPRCFVDNKLIALCVAQSYQWRFTIIALKWLFWLLKPKSCLGKKLMAFQQFSSNCNRWQWVFSI